MIQHVNLGHLMVATRDKKLSFQISIDAGNYLVTFQAVFPKIWEQRINYLEEQFFGSLQNFGSGITALKVNKEFLASKKFEYKVVFKRADEIS